MHTAAVWLQKVKESYGDGLQIRWHSFPLEQVNSIQDPEWKLWEQPDDYRSKSLWAFRAGEAARLQGPEAFQRYHLALLRARHEERRDIADREVLAQIAAEAGLDVVRFRRDLPDRSLLAKIGDDYNRGVQDHGVWGTPTLVFEGGRASYLKLRPAPPPEDALALFNGLFDLIYGKPYVLEIKRPR